MIVLSRIATLWGIRDLRGGFVMKKILLGLVLSSVISFKLFASCSDLCPQGKSRLSFDEQMMLKGEYDANLNIKRPVDCSLKGKCPDLKCRQFGDVFYMLVINGDFRCSEFGYFGYGVKQTSLYYSDLRDTSFMAIQGASMNGSIYNEKTLVDGQEINSKELTSTMTKR